MHCLPGTETMASSYVDAKNRQQVSDGLTAEKGTGTMTMVLKRIIWGIRFAWFVDRFPSLRLPGSDMVSVRQDGYGKAVSGQPSAV